MKLENEILYVEMVEHGAELTRIYNKKTGGRDLMECRSKVLEKTFAGFVPECRKNLA